MTIEEPMTPIEHAREFDKLWHHELDDDWRSVVTTFTNEIDFLRTALAAIEAQLDDEVLGREVAEERVDDLGRTDMRTMNEMIDAIEALTARLAREEDATDEARRCAEIQRQAKFMALEFHGQGLDRRCKADRFPWETS